MAGSNPGLAFLSPRHLRATSGPRHSGQLSPARL